MLVGFMVGRYASAARNWSGNGLIYSDQRCRQPRYRCRALPHCRPLHAQRARQQTAPSQVPCCRRRRWPQTRGCRLSAQCASPRAKIQVMRRERMVQSLPASTCQVHFQEGRPVPKQMSPRRRVCSNAPGFLVSRPPPSGPSSRTRMPLRWCVRSRECPRLWSLHGMTLSPRDGSGKEAARTRRAPQVPMHRSTGARRSCSMRTATRAVASGAAAWSATAR
mmetsp:Transcript_57396/g.162975  ORF Transcript_57396/g.162975 Transcript_57396/m.162975 type:complete len:221 (-) Transcript_57396:882-1544(-)